MSTGSVEVVYRGIFQKTLAKNICRGIVLAARKEGKIGIAFGRYGEVTGGCWSAWPRRTPTAEDLARLDRKRKGSSRTRTGFPGATPRPRSPR